MKILLAAVFVACVVTLTLYAGRETPAEQYERPIIIWHCVLYVSSVAITIRAYSDGDTMICRYSIDPKHAREAAEFLALELIEDRLNEREWANMELRRQHVRQFLGCWWTGERRKTTWGRLKGAKKEGAETGPERKSP